MDMFTFVKTAINQFYYFKIKKIDGSTYNIIQMRKKGITVGDGCRIFSNLYTYAGEPYLISIGDNVTISSGVELCTHDNAVIKVVPGKTDIVGRITIGNNCFIGMRAIVMYGVTLGDNCIVGAGSVVTHSFPANSVVAGNPARLICTAEEYGNKYRDYAINFKALKGVDKKKYFEDHPELLVKR